PCAPATLTPPSRRCAPSSPPPTPTSAALPAPPWTRPTGRTAREDSPCRNLRRPPALAAVPGRNRRRGRRLGRTRGGRTRLHGPHRRARTRGTPPRTRPHAYRGPPAVDDQSVLLPGRAGTVQRGRRTRPGSVGYRGQSPRRPRTHDARRPGTRPGADLQLGRRG